MKLAKPGEASDLARILGCLAPLDSIALGLYYLYKCCLKFFIQRLVDYQSSGDIFWILYPIRLVGFKMFQVYIYISFSIHTRMMATSWFLATSSMIPGLQGFWWLDTSNGVSKVLRSPSVDLCEALQMLLRMAGLVFGKTCHGNEKQHRVLVSWLGMSQNWLKGKQLQETIGNPGDIDVPSKQSIEIIEIGYFATEEHLIRWNCLLWANISLVPKL